MKIANLNHCTSTTQDIVGGHKPKKPVYVPGINTAVAGAEALAIGKFTATSTFAGALTIASFSSASASGASAISVG